LNQVLRHRRCRNTALVSFLNFHPATLLALWIAFAVLLQTLALSWLAAIAVPVIGASLLGAGRRALILLRRARWLLLSVLVLFVFGTPGERLPGTAGDFGMTFDGLVAGLEQLLRLLLLLVTLAWLHQRLGSNGMVAGFHRLLMPLSAWRDLRERLVVRLLLVLENVDSEPAMTWRQWLSEPPTGGRDFLVLNDAAITWPDRLAFAAVAVALLWFGFWR
jgi:hypothetical protein